MNTHDALAVVALGPLALAAIAAIGLTILFGAPRALAADTPLIEDLGEFTELPVKASATIFRGSAIGLTGGYARALNAGDRFAGHAWAAVTGGASDGDVLVRVRTGRYRLQVDITGIAVTDVGKVVYMSDDATYTLTPSTNTPVGKVVRYVGANKAIVEFRAPGLTPSAAAAALTTITHTAPGTPDFALQDLTDSGGFGFKTKDEGNTLCLVVAQLQAAVAELAGLS